MEPGLVRPGRTGTAMAWSCHRGDRAAQDEAQGAPYWRRRWRLHSLAHRLLVPDRTLVAGSTSKSRVHLKGIQTGRIGFRWRPVTWETEGVVCERTMSCRAFFAQPTLVEEETDAGPAVPVLNAPKADLRNVAGRKAEPDCCRTALAVTPAGTRQRHRRGPGESVPSLADALLARQALPA